jgi:GNAT superfamily N-acetyltransferase
MIREVTSLDSSRVVGLLQQLWPERRGEPEKTARVIREYADGPDYWIYGYEEEGVLLGVITVSFRWALYCEGKVAVIEDLIVDEVHRGKGIERKLVGFAEGNIAEESEVKAIELNSDFHREGAHKSWKKCGYSRLAFQYKKEVQGAW